jgi:hypothetical protein
MALNRNIVDILFKAIFMSLLVISLTNCKSPQTYKGTPPKNKPLPCTTC